MRGDGGRGVPSRGADSPPNPPTIDAEKRYVYRDTVKTVNIHADAIFISFRTIYTKNGVESLPNAVRHRSTGGNKFGTYRIHGGI